MRCPVPQSRRLRIRGVKITGRPASPILAFGGLGRSSAGLAARLCGGVGREGHRKLRWRHSRTSSRGRRRHDRRGRLVAWPASTVRAALSPLLAARVALLDTAPFGRPTRPRPDVGAAGSRAGSASPAGAPGKRTRLEDAGARHRKGLCAWAEFCTLMLTCTGVRRIAHLHR